MNQKGFCRRIKVRGTPLGALLALLLMTGLLPRQTAATTCLANQHVSAMTCVACPVGFINEAGDDVNGGDTTCDAALSLPPSDGGGGWSWTKDGGVPYGGFHTFTKDFSSGNCPGVYRVKTNKDWHENSGDSGAYGANEGVPPAAFDGLSGHDNTGETYFGIACGGTNCDIELILELPCSLRLFQFGVGARDENAFFNRAPSAMKVYGSNDMGTTWTEIGSFTGETGWTQAETRYFNADNSLGAFTSFKFFIETIEDTDTTARVNVRDLFLYGQEEIQIQIPPNDIGQGDSWTKDTVNTYNGIETLYKDYSGAVCPGRYVAKSNTLWANAGTGGTFGASELPPSGAFDGMPWSTSTASGLQFANQVGGTSGTEANIEVILEVPCQMNLERYTILSRTSSDANVESPSKMTVYGSSDMGATWNQVGGFDGETSWTESEMKTFTADGSMGPFGQFKFVFQRYNTAADNQHFSVGEIELFTINWHSASGSTVIIPPSDIGSGSTWTKDDTVQYNNRYTLYKDYSGSTCAGRYRAMSSTSWNGDSGVSSWGSSESPPSGAFDRLPSDSAQSGQHYSMLGVDMAGTSATSDSNGELVLEIPCEMELDSFTLEASHDSIASTRSPSKGEMQGSMDGTTWTMLGSFSGETSWTGAERKTFTASSGAGSYFRYFRFVTQRISDTADQRLLLAEVELHARSWRPAGEFLQ
uniref:F5/8 type C domain-containing protein n=1 Tax=Chromera velia CCMP2878 TaxID=1169474 RepID=A0A0G4HJL7_9ALVE|eukprot:Cvel_28298.t1-p1 / transcript=Cvel_28298.t1 / gene=Cvel_28298 / organism=Chromera_velia_CCMP2878 / gene_product=hypothetical protein / transcript_product=hypothetical protein / location=Cvel_scaffold3672:7952-12377(+) / protein_length=700 / sequence_SO=supercontig / SO=protein_coding / is_pseudo=false